MYHTIIPSVMIGALRVLFRNFFYSFAIFLYKGSMQ